MIATSELIRKLERDLAALQRIPAARREAELADVREEICQSMLGDLLGGIQMLSVPSSSDQRDALGRLPLS